MIFVTVFYFLTNPVILDWMLDGINFILWSVRIWPFIELAEFSSIEKLCYNSIFLKFFFFFKLNCSRFRVVFNLQPAGVCLCRMPSDNKYVHSGWWELENLPALFELWEIVNSQVPGWSFLSLTEFHFMPAHLQLSEDSRGIDAHFWSSFSMQHPHHQNS